MDQALHLIAVNLVMAGMLYLPRLFPTICEPRSDQKQSER